MVKTKRLLRHIHKLFLLISAIWVAPRASLSLDFFSFAAHSLFHSKLTLMNRLNYVCSYVYVCAVYVACLWLKYWCTYRGGGSACISHVTSTVSSFEAPISMTRSICLQTGVSVDIRKLERKQEKL